MKINTESLVPITEANQNFSRVARLVDETASVVILKNNVPHYLVIDFQQAEQEREALDEDIQAVSQRLIRQNRAAYQDLAK